MPGILCIVVAAWNWDPFWSAALSEVEAILCLNKLPPPLLKLGSNLTRQLIPTPIIHWKQKLTCCEVHLGSVVIIKTRNSSGLSFLFAADFGDFSRYDSQDFLQKFVLFPIVSPLFVCFFFCAFFVSVFQMWDKNMLLLLCCLCIISGLSLQDWIQDERVLEEATQKVALLYQSFRWTLQSTSPCMRLPL